MAQTSTHYVAVLARQAEKLGLDLDAVLISAGISPGLVQGQEQWIDNACLAALVKNLWRHANDETMGLAPNPMRMGTWALSCDYMLAAENLGELYRRGERVYD